MHSRVCNLCCATLIMRHLRMTTNLRFHGTAHLSKRALDEIWGCEESSNHRKSRILHGKPSTQPRRQTMGNHVLSMASHLHSSVFRVNCMMRHLGMTSHLRFHGRSTGVKNQLTIANHIFSMANHVRSYIDRVSSMMGHLSMITIGNHVLSLANHLHSSVFRVNCMMRHLSMTSHLRFHGKSHCQEEPFEK